MRAALRSFALAAGRPLRRRVAALAAATLICSSSCTARRPETRPDTGTLTVGISSDGPGTADLDLQIAVDGTIYDVKADGGLVTVRTLAPGELRLQLRGLPSGCAAEGGTDRTVAIRAGRTTALRMVVHCRPPAPAGASASPSV